MIEAAERDETVIVGMGNIIRSDDGAGVHALRRLERDPRVPHDVVLIDGGTSGISLLPRLHKCARLLFLDAVDFGEPAGTLIRLEQDDLFKLTGAASVHQLGIADLLTTLSLVSPRFPETIVLGVQSASTDWGTEPTSAVAGALDGMVNAAIQQLLLWTGEHTLPR
jgi:hydrogenase maturation protease